MFRFRKTHLKVFKTKYIKNTNRRIVTDPFDTGVDSFYDPLEGTCIQRHCHGVSGIFSLEIIQEKYNIRNILAENDRKERS